MPRFSRRSQAILSTCHPDLQRVFRAVIRKKDCTILEGHRSSARQARLFAEGKSRVKVSTHNALPSNAVDAAPYPIDWEDTAEFVAFGLLVMETAKRLGVRMRWGGDWDGDGDHTDQTFNDLVHFERLP